ncbi:muconate/chloromuconate family cycloisomerase [Marinobacter psychrophilus]|jgi:muconate cycloisomerase|uniref:muconate/chloromuconate family cycloisomerase n=1 Tax=Marinobacter psychrophilus TaxID=330734 RepID=UPI001B60131E|nr:muconate/chloromuconate family cycloisomerase [Marinobacter psychrophilus]MBQ0761846.1 muconate/chloromuconate family cycloisomerase [Marinobacter psychrophilus]MBQ0846504.1 muconate/chloromuconate family cycloisomerase [Marinobacter psychrophilus]
MSAAIQSIEAILVDIPTIRPHKLSMTTMGVQTMVIVRIKDSAGLEGLGEATTIGGLAYGPESPESVKLTIDTYFKPLLIDQPADAINTLRVRLNCAVRGNNLAKSAIETALLDMQGKRLSRPLCDLLGGALHQHIPVLWTLASGDTEKDIEEAHSILAQNRHRDFKLKIGSRALMDDVRHVAAIKEAVGDRASVRVDVNQAWDEATAAKGMAELQAAGIDLVEQPTPMKDFAALVRLSKKFHIPILADESVADAKDMFALAAAGFSGAVAMKIAKAGGPARALEQAMVAQASGIGLYGGTLLEGTIGSAASLHAWSTLETLHWGTEMFGPLLMRDDIVVTPLNFHDNGVDLPSGPGLGVEIDEDKLTHYRRK